MSTPQLRWVIQPQERRKNDPRDHALAGLPTTDSKTRRWPESLNDEMLSI